MTSEEAKKIARNHLSDKRYEHSCNVARAAAKLAKKYGADEETAKIAGYLHDILKERPKSDLLKMIEAFDIIDGNEISRCPSLYHAFAGGIYVQKELGLSQEIADAVSYHTTGRAGMTVMEKILYLSDYISADRKFDGVERIRNLAKKDPDRALFEALRDQIRFLADSGSYIDRHSIEAYNDLIPKGEQK